MKIIKSETGVILSLLFFLPVMPLIGCMIALYLLLNKKEQEKKNLQVISIVAGISISLLQLYAIFLVASFVGNLFSSLASPGDIQANDEIERLYSEAKYSEIISIVDAYYLENDLSYDNLGILYYRALSNRELGREKEAKDDLELLIGKLKSVDNVRQRRYADVYYVLALEYFEDDEYIPALNYIDEALKLDSSNPKYRLLKGEILDGQGNKDQALEIFTQISKEITNPEIRYISDLKKNRIDEEVSFRFTDTDKKIIDSLSISLVPINGYDDDLPLDDLCLLLESKYFIRCETLNPVELNESKIDNPKRRQYYAEAILDELGEIKKNNMWNSKMLIGMTSMDMYSEGSNYVYSLVERGPLSRGVGVISTSRLKSNLPDIKDKDLVFTRRIAIQLISSFGQMLDFSRPTSPQCPLSYPNDLVEFRKKTTKLCDSTISQRDEYLKRFELISKDLTDEKISEYNRVYSYYCFE